MGGGTSFWSLVRRRTIAGFSSGISRVLSLLIRIMFVKNLLLQISVYAYSLQVNVRIFTVARNLKAEVNILVLLDL